jgi:hypothetical protein
MINDEAGSAIGVVRVGFREVPVVRLSAETLNSRSIDLRVSAIAQLLEDRKMVITDCDPVELLSEPQTDAAALARGKIIKVIGETYAGSGGKVPDERSVALEAMQLFINSLPECTVEYRSDGPPLGSLCDTVGSKLIFFPDDVFEVASQLGIISAATCERRWRSSKWRSKVMNVLELPKRFSTENCEWPQSDCSRYLELDPGKQAIAKALGLEGNFDSMRTARSFGRAIGESIGAEQAHSWLATDLKLEHFVGYSEGHVAHVDHSDDIFLLREPFISEMASCVAPLYQQMDFVQWQGFREGYVDKLAAVAVDVLTLLEGDIAMEIMAAYCAKSASMYKRKEEYDRALDYCSLIEEIGNKMAKGTEGQVAFLRGRLVRGDVLMAADRLEDATLVYTAAIKELITLQTQGCPVGDGLCGGYINLALARNTLGFHNEAAQYLDRAQNIANEMKNSDPEQADYLLQVIDHNRKNMVSADVSTRRGKRS